MDQLDLRDGADAAWQLVSQANLYIQQSAPWTLAKEGKDPELDEVLGGLARCLYRLAVLASPFVPGKAQTLWQALGQPGEAAAAHWASVAHPPVAGTATTKPEVLFPKPAPA
jgi:methionyl-tRNA synthetase